MIKSEKFNFNLPEGSDFYNVEDFNTNFQTIDGAMYSLKLGGAVNSGEDLNNYKTPGVYQMDSAIMSSLLNCPVTSGYGVLVVRNMYSQNGVIQEIHWRATSYNNYRKYTRVYLSGGYPWTEWKGNFNNWMFSELKDTNVMSESGNIILIASKLTPGEVITWFHNDTHAIKLLNAPHREGCVTLWRLPGGNSSALFQGSNGVLYYKGQHTQEWLNLNTYANDYVEGTV